MPKNVYLLNRIWIKTHASRSAMDGNRH